MPSKKRATLSDHALKRHRAAARATAQIASLRRQMLIFRCRVVRFRKTRNLASGCRGKAHDRVQGWPAGVETGNAPGSIQAALDGEETATYCSNCWRMWCTANIQRSPRSCAQIRAGDFAPELLARVFQATEFGFSCLRSSNSIPR